MFREEMSYGSALGIAADQLTRHGKLVPDEMVCQVVEAWLGAHNGKFIFDGFPRSLGQANALEAMLAKRKTPLEVALFLKTDFETISSRVKSRLVCSKCHATLSAGLNVPNVKTPCPNCGGQVVRRSDDNPETLSQRMQEYQEKTEPLIEHYLQKGLLRTVDSVRSPELVFAAIAEILEEK